MGRRMHATTVYLEADQVDLLRLLSERTKVPVAEYVRQGIDLALERNDWQVHKHYEAPRVELVANLKDKVAEMVMGELQQL